MENVHAGIKKGPTQPDFYYKCLFSVGIVMFLNIILANSLEFVVYNTINHLCIIPCMLFLGFAWGQGIDPSAKKKLYLCLGAVIWFVIIEAIYSESRQLNERTIGIYMMAFPFAAFVRDEKRGLNFIAKLYVAATVVLMGYAIMLMMDLWPDSMSKYMYWSGARLYLFRHANNTGCIFMIGISFSIALIIQENTKWKKYLYMAIAVMQFWVLALTNCRTAIFLNSAIIAGLVFFYVCRRGWKCFFVGAVSALLVMIALNVFSNMIWDMHNEFLIIRQSPTQMEAVQAESEAEVVYCSEIIPDAKVTQTGDKATNDMGEVYSEQKDKLQFEGGQGSLLADIWTLNSRTLIWKATIQSIRDDPWILLRGTPDISGAIGNNFGTPVYPHNSWLNVLMGYGIPGLLIALAFTWIAVKNSLLLLLKQKEQLWKKVIALMVLCLLAHGFLERFLFFPITEHVFFDFIFLLCTGYLSFWQQKLSDETDF